MIDNLIEAFKIPKGSLILTVSLTILVLGLGRKFERNIYMHALGLYISTVLHELAHYIVGKALLLDIKGMRLYPTLVKDINGRFNLEAPSVHFNEKAGQGFRIIPMALAPIILFPIAYYIEQNWFTYFTYENDLEYLFLQLGLIYILVILIYNGFPSWTDLSFILAYPYSFSLWVLITSITIYYFDEVVNIYNNMKGLI